MEDWKKVHYHDNKVVVFGSAFTNGHLMFMISYYYIVLIPHSCSLQSYLIKDFFFVCFTGIRFRPLEFEVDFQLKFFLHADGNILRLIKTERIVFDFLTKRFFLFFKMGSPKSSLLLAKKVSK